MSFIHAWLRTLWGGRDDEILYSRRVKILNRQISTKLNLFRAGLLVAIVATSVPWLRAQSHTSVSPYEAPWHDLAKSIQKFELEPEFQAPFSDINNAIHLLAQSHSQLARTVQHDILERIPSAAARPDVCNEKRRIVDAIIEATPRIRDLSSLRNELAHSAAKLEPKARRAARYERSRCETTLQQLGTVGRLTERGYAIAVRAESKAQAAQEMKDVISHIVLVVGVFGRRLDALRYRWEKLAREGRCVSSRKVLEISPCLRSSRVDRLLEDARQLSVEFLSTDELVGLETSKP